MYEIFSNWIFVWFILYNFNIIKYNPLFLLIIGYILTIGELIYMVFRKISYYNFIKYFIINVLIKFIPIILILKKNNFEINIKVIDIYASFILVLIYIFIMSIANKNPYNFYNMFLNTYIKDDNKYRSIFSKTYDYIYIKIIKK